MNRDEAVNTVEFIMAAFQNAAKWEDAAVELWIEDLEECDYSRSRRAVRQCRNEHDYLSWAKFMDAYRSLTRTELSPDRQLYAPMAIEGPKLAKEDVAPTVAALRDVLRNATKNVSDL